MQDNQETPGRVRRTVNDLVLAEMFIVQATIESANAIGDGITELSRRLADDDEQEGLPKASITGILQRTADDVIEPYTTRFRYFRDVLKDD